ncbi:putative Ig domain-containing protein [Pyxidicoccus sp. 3LG]
MPDIRVIAWNIKDFKSNQVGTPGTWQKHANTILGVLYNAANVRQCDIFVIVEPFFRSNLFNFGDLVLQAPGLEGVLELYFALAAKDAAWKVVPLRASADAPKSDMIAVFYHSGAVDFTGPHVLNGVPALTTTVATPANHARPWNNATTRAGQVEFFDAANTALDFMGRSPYLTTFNVPDRVKQTVTLTVANAGGALGVKTAALPAGVANQPYLFVLQAEAGTPPYAWAQAGGTNLPAGLALNGNRLEGTPTAAGNFTLNVTLTDSVPSTVNKSLNFTIAAANANLAFTTAANLPDAVAGQPYELFLTTTGGTGSAREVAHVRNQVTDALPAGMTLGADGRLTWNNPVAGNHSFDVEVLDRTTARLPITLTVTNAPGGALAVASTALPNGVANKPYLFVLQANGGTPPYAWAQGATTNLPAGLALNGNRLEGTPTAAGNFTLDVDLTDGAAGAANAVLNFTVAAASANLAFPSGGNLPAAITGQPYEITLPTTGARGQGVVVHAKALPTDTLPAGMTLDADGTLKWNNPTAGNHAFDVEVTDSARAFKLVGVHAPPEKDWPDNAAMVENLAGILEITTRRNGFAAAVCGDFNVCPLNAGICNNKHDVRDRNALSGGALGGLTGVGFTSQNANRRSSLQGCSNGQKKAFAAARDNGTVVLDDIGANAFDHVLTQGFNAVHTVNTMNLVALDAGYAAAIVQAQNGALAASKRAAPIKGIVRKYLWSDGVSDHLPVQFTLNLA